MATLRRSRAQKGCTLARKEPSPASLPFHLPSVRGVRQHDLQARASALIQRHLVQVLYSHSS